MACAWSDKINAIIAAYNALACGSLIPGGQNVCGPSNVGVLTYIYNQITSYSYTNPPPFDAACTTACHGIAVETEARPTWPPVADCGDLDAFLTWVEGVEIWGQFNIHIVGGYACSAGGPVCIGPPLSPNYPCGADLILPSGPAPRDPTTTFGWGTPWGLCSYSMGEIIVTDACADTTGADPAALWDGELIVSLKSDESYGPGLVVIGTYGQANEIPGCLNNGGIFPIPILGI